MNEQLQELLAIVIRNTVILIGIVNVAAVMTLVERKVSAWMQFRHGPNRVGPWGLLQPLADGVKFIFKEEVMPDGVNKTLFRLAPILAALPASLRLFVFDCHALDVPAVDACVGVPNWVERTGTWVNVDGVRGPISAAKQRPPGVRTLERHLDELAALRRGDAARARGAAAAGREVAR